MIYGVSYNYIHIYDSSNEHTNVQAGNIFIWKEVRVGVIYWNSTSLNQFRSNQQITESSLYP